MAQPRRIWRSESRNRVPSTLTAREHRLLADNRQPKRHLRNARLVGLGNDNSWRLELDDSGNLSAITGQNGDPGQPDAVATITALPTGQPLFVVALFDGLAARADLRVRSADGTVDQSASETADPRPGWGAAPSVWHLDIGSTSSSTYAALTIEQLGIWADLWLTPAQQNFLYAAGAGRRLM